MMISKARFSNEFANCEWLQKAAAAFFQRVVVLVLWKQCVSVEKWKEAEEE